MLTSVLLGGDRPWLRRLLGISVAPQVGSIFNEAVCDNTAKRWNGIAARRATRSDANNHRRYMVTRNSLDAARCSGEPLLVLARNRVFLCIFFWRGMSHLTPCLVNSCMCPTPMVST